jgi:hypothetical protein
MTRTDFIGKGQHQLVGVSYGAVVLSVTLGTTCPRPRDPPISYPSMVFMSGGPPGCAWSQGPDDGRWSRFSRASARRTWSGGREHLGPVAADEISADRPAQHRVTGTDGQHDGCAEAQVVLVCGPVHLWMLGDGRVHQPAEAFGPKDQVAVGRPVRVHRRRALEPMLVKQPPPPDP